MNDEAYWTAGPETRADLQRQLDNLTRINEARSAFIRRVGATAIFGTPNWVIGATFADGVKPGPEWVPLKKYPGVHGPNRKSKAGRALDRELSTFRVGSWQGLGTHIGPAEPGGGCRFWSGRAEFYGDTAVIVHHREAKVPADCTPMKASAYFLLKEQHEEEKAAEASAA